MGEIGGARDKDSLFALGVPFSSSDDMTLSCVCVYFF